DTDDASDARRGLRRRRAHAGGARGGLARTPASGDAERAHDPCGARGRPAPGRARCAPPASPRSRSPRPAVRRGGRPRRGRPPRLSGARGTGRRPRDAGGAPGTRGAATAPMTRAERWLLVLAVLVATGTLAAGLARTDLWPPNETRIAEISREMLAGESWALPRLNGEPFLEEPPLFYWMQAVLYRLTGGPSAAAARIPAAAGALVGVLVTVVLARAVGVNAGIAALVLATAPEYWWMARTG